MRQHPLLLALALASCSGSVGSSPAPDGTAPRGDGYGPPAPDAAARAGEDGPRDGWPGGDGGLPGDAPAPTDGCPSGHQLAEGRCLPSCGVAGGTLCYAQPHAACLGQQHFETYDCPVCCRVCDRTSTPPTTLPAIVHYSFISVIDAAGSFVAIDEPASERLIVPGLDVIFTIAHKDFRYPGWTGPVNGDLRTGTNANWDTCAPQTAAFARWRGLGASLGFALSNDALQAWLDEGSAADRIEHLLRYGWDYLVVDEIGGVAWRDAEQYGQLIVPLLQELTARGLGRRIILWVNPSTTEIWKNPATDPTGALSNYAQLFAACQQHCRALIFESYPANSTTCLQSTPARCVTTSTIVNSGTDQYLEWLATRISNAAAGTNTVALTGIGASAYGTIDFLDLPSCDLAPYRGTCAPSPGNGGLRRQLAALHAGAHAKYQRGVAFYGAHKVLERGVWTRADLAEYLRTLTSWWVGK